MDVHFRCFSDEQMSKKAVAHQPNNVHNVAWVFPKIGVPQNGWFIIENPIKMDDLGGSPIFGNTNMAFFAHVFNRDTTTGRNCHMHPMGPPKDSCHGVGNPSGVGISKDQEPHATQLQIGSFFL